MPLWRKPEVVVVVVWTGLARICNSKWGGAFCARAGHTEVETIGIAHTMVRRGI